MNKFKNFMMGMRDAFLISWIVPIPTQPKPKPVYISVTDGNDMLIKHIRYSGTGHDRRTVYIKLSEQFVDELTTRVISNPEIALIIRMSDTPPSECVCMR